MKYSLYINNEMLLESNSKKKIIDEFKLRADLYRQTGYTFLEQTPTKIRVQNKHASTPEEYKPVTLEIKGIETSSLSEKSTQSLTSKNKTIMAKQIQIGTRRDGSPVMSKAVTASVYRPQGTKNKKPAMVVPVQYVTLPQGFYTHATKKLYTNKSYNGTQQSNTYVIGCAFTRNNKKLYVVAQLTYMGGKPAVAVNHYRGYSKRTAWIVFHNLPYHEVKYIKPDPKDNVIFQGDGSYHQVIRDSIERRNQFKANRQQGSGRYFRSDPNGASYSHR